MASALTTSEPVTPDPLESVSAHPASDLAADAALVLAALGRIQSAAHSDRVALTRLRAALGELADTIAKAKAMMFASAADEPTLDTPALLDHLEQLVDAMIATAGGSAPERAEPAPQPPAPAATSEMDEVPTVSAVVSGLGGSEPTSADEEAPAVNAEQVPSVAMLKAMVEALNASVPPRTAEGETAPATAQPEVAAIIAEPDAVAIAEPAAIAEPEAAPAPPPQPPITVAMNELLASYERMEARPIPPPDEGMAVIFGAVEADVAPPYDAEAATVEAMESAAAHAQPEIEPAAVGEALDPPPNEPAQAAATETDAEDLLFGPEPEADPAAFLLEPEPLPEPEPLAESRAATGVLPPHPEFVAPRSEPSVAETPTSSAAQSAAPAAKPNAIDPMAPLNGLSEAERIAMFS